MNHIHRFLQSSESSAEQGALNPFLATLSFSITQPKAVTPYQVFQTHLKELEQIAKKGDIVAWNEQLPRVFAKAEDAEVAIQEDLETKISLYQWEMTLLLEAGNKAAEFAEELKGQIKRETDPGRVGQLSKKATHFESLAKQLHLQLWNKTN